jgi:hypothetical protein
MESRKYSHLTFTELEVHIAAMQAKLSQEIAQGSTIYDGQVQRDNIRQQLADLEEELENRREHLLK